MDTQQYQLIGESIWDTYRSIGFILLGEDEKEAREGGSQKQRRFSKEMADNIRSLQRAAAKKPEQRRAERRVKPREPWPLGQGRRRNDPGAGGQADRRRST